MARQTGSSVNIQGYLATRVIGLDALHDETVANTLRVTRRRRMEPRRVISVTARKKQWGASTHHLMRHLLAFSLAADSTRHRMWFGTLPRTVSSTGASCHLCPVLT